MSQQFSQDRVLRMFYLCGSIIFLIVGIANIFTNVYFWPNMITSARVSAVFSNIFNFVLAFFFYSLLKGVTASKPEPIKDKTLDDIFKGAYKK